MTLRLLSEPLLYWRSSFFYVPHYGLNSCFPISLVTFINIFYFFFLKKNSSFFLLAPWLTAIRAHETLLFSTQEIRNLLLLLVGIGVVFVSVRPEYSHFRAAIITSVQITKKKSNFIPLGFHYR